MQCARLSGIPEGSLFVTTACMQPYEDFAGRGAVLAQPATTSSDETIASGDDLKMARFIRRVAPIVIPPVGIPDGRRNEFKRLGIIQRR